MLGHCSYPTNLATLAIPAYGPQVVADILHSLQYPHIVFIIVAGFFGISYNTRI